MQFSGEMAKIIGWRTPHLENPGSATVKGFFFVNTVVTWKGIFYIIFLLFVQKRRMSRLMDYVSIQNRRMDVRLSFISPWRHIAVRTGKESRLPEEAHLLPFSIGWFLFSAGWFYFCGTCEEDISAMWSSQSNQMASNLSQIPRWNYLHLTSSGSASYRQRKGRRAEQILKWEYVCSILFLSI